MLVRYYGHVGGASGYGQAANETCMAILEAGIDLEISTDGKQLRPPYLPLSRYIKHEEGLTPRPDAIVVHTLPIDCAKLLRRVDHAAVRKVIAYTTWEGASPTSEPVNQAMRSGFTDIWVPSHCNDVSFSQGLSGYWGSVGTISVVPHAFSSDLAGPAARVGAKATGTYRFYYIGAWNARKNPEGVIRAYLREFSKSMGDDVALVIQAYGAGESACTVARIATGLRLEDTPPIIFSRDRISDAAIRDLHQSCNCFVTATRGEAWNLPAFDAMVTGNHIIAPAGMGSDDFLLETSAALYPGRPVPAGGEVCLVSDPMAPAGHASAVYVGAQGLTVKSDWIEPDITKLAWLMRQAYAKRPDLCMNYDPATRFSRQAVGAHIRSLLQGDA